MSNWEIRGEGPLCICEREREEERKWCSPCSSLSARCSRWLSRVEGAASPQGALGTPSALQWARSPPSQHSPNTQASAIKTTPNKHTPNTLTTCGGVGRLEGAGRGMVEQRFTEQLHLLCYLNDMSGRHQLLLSEFRFDPKLYKAYICPNFIGS